MIFMSVFFWRSSMLRGMLFNCAVKRRLGLSVIGLMCLVGNGVRGETAVQAPLRLVGSDYLAPLVQKVSSEFDEVALALEGTYPAINDLKEGKAAAGLLFWTDEEELDFGEEWVVLEWGYLTLLVAVVEQNPLQELSLAQLQGIFLSGRDDMVSRWGDLGLPGVWAARVVTPMFYQDTQRLCTGMFLTRFPGNNNEFRANLRRFSRIHEAVNEAAGQNSSVVVVPYGTELDGLKSLPLVGAGSQVAYPATPENMETGRYPLTLPVKLVYRRSQVEELAAMLRTLYSVDTLEEMKALGIAPVSDSTRMRYQLNFDFME